MSIYNEVASYFNKKVQELLRINPHLQFPQNQQLFQQEIRKLIDQHRKEKLIEYCEKTNREIIVYYTDSNKWTVLRNGMQIASIQNHDVELFETILESITNNKKSLDLVIQTPGGVIEITEKIVKMLQKTFKGDIRIIVPFRAKSAGTIIACAGKEIVMGSSSSLGPIDPQLSGGISAHFMLKEIEEIKEKKTTFRNSVFPLGFEQFLLSVVNLANELLEKFLKNYMKIDDLKVKKIIQNLNEIENSKSHGREFDIDFCKTIGLKVKSFEEIQKEYDSEGKDINYEYLIMYIHYLYFYTFNNLTNVKIIESKDEVLYV